MWKRTVTIHPTMQYNSHSAPTDNADKEDTSHIVLLQHMHIYSVNSSFQLLNQLVPHTGSHQMNSAHSRMIIGSELNKRPCTALRELIIKWDISSFVYWYRGNNFTTPNCSNNRDFSEKQRRFIGVEHLILGHLHMQSICLLVFLCSLHFCIWQGLFSHTWGEVSCGKISVSLYSSNKKPTASSRGPHFPGKLVTPLKWRSPTSSTTQLYCDCSQSI